MLEIDGGYHERFWAQKDARRDEWLRRRGYAVLRLSESLVMRELSQTVALISAAIAELRR